jgi:hypothetical protein
MAFIKRNSIRIFMGFVLIAVPSFIYSEINYVQVLKRALEDNLENNRDDFWVIGTKTRTRIENNKQQKSSPVNSEKPNSEQPRYMFFKNDQGGYIRDLGPKVEKIFRNPRQEKNDAELKKFKRNTLKKIKEAVKEFKEIKLTDEQAHRFIARCL